VSHGWIPYDSCGRRRSGGSCFWRDRIAQKENGLIAQAPKPAVLIRSSGLTRHSAEPSPAANNQSFAQEIFATDADRPKPAEEAAILMQYLTVTIPEKAVTIGSRIGLADTFLTRLFGLLGKSSLDDGSGILIRPSSGVHTMWMRFAIDVVALDKNLRVLKTWERLRPWRVTPVSLKTHCVLELAPGQISQLDIKAGDQLALST
jgi:hypothetical protein